jgi:hypothetical protein
MSDDHNDDDLHHLIHGPAEQRAASEAAANPDRVVIDLAKLKPLQYAKARVQNAKLLGVTVGALDAEVKRRRPKDDERDFLPHWNVEPWPEEVDGDALLDELRNYFRRYVVLPEEADVALALWVLHTWVFDCFDITPYLAITSPTPRCGKTVLMTLLYWLCSRAKKSDSMSKAVIYRSVDTEKPTLILDEVNWILDLTDERAGIVNGGFERNGYAETCEGEGAAIKPRRWSTYCPKALGLIGRLTPTLMDRSIEITMRRKTEAESAERLRRRDNDEHATLRRKCRRWAEDNINALKMAPEMVAADLNDRAVDCWEPLLIVAKHAGDEWLGRALYAARVLSADDTRKEEGVNVELLRDVQQISVGKKHFRDGEISTKVLLAALSEDPEKRWATYATGGKPITDRQVAKLLGTFQITSETVHAFGGVKGYKLVRFQEPFERYLTPQKPRPKASAAPYEGLQAPKRPNLEESATSGDFLSAQKGNPGPRENEHLAAQNADLGAWALRNSPRAPKSASAASGDGSSDGSSDVVFDDPETDFGLGVSLVSEPETDPTPPLAKVETPSEEIPAFLRRCIQCGGASDATGAVTEHEIEGARIWLHGPCADLRQRRPELAAVHPSITMRNGPAH